ncbi:hypothetical protein [Motilimonas eburnea]|uniref:hypothetical protein n=1 Tax=Motilimonas eburnea TaxID=1737488 RepID=UPI001E33801B|nr:hypothetical protein [Motilimonas eburnea]MCE2571681.1 hypothetical protein [Motilimonas eburnea]
MDALITYYVKKTLTEHGYGELDGLYWEYGDHPFDDIAVFGSLSTQALVDKAGRLPIFNDRQQWDLTALIWQEQLQLDSLRKDKFSVEWLVTNAPVFNSKQKQLISWLEKEIKRELSHLKNQMYAVIRLIMEARGKQKVLVDKTTKNLNVVVSITYDDAEDGSLLELGDEEEYDHMVKHAILGSMLYGTVTVDIYNQSDMVNIYTMTKGGCAIYQTLNGHWQGLSEIVSKMITEERPFFDLPETQKVAVLTEPVNSIGWLSSLIPA